MTPQEQDVNELFDRLAELESNPRHPDAERLIADGLRRAPHAAYALVQTALVQDEALKHANARIDELQAQVGGEEQQRRGGFSTVCATPSSAGASRELGAIGTLASASFTHSGSSSGRARGRQRDPSLADVYRHRES
jgi:hypothetical protein